MKIEECAWYTRYARMRSTSNKDTYKKDMDSALGRERNNKVQLP